jgi:nanoRNase/pAp phosphatase (c-di-AMP/oligoRNAs hydrolase)
MRLITRSDFDGMACAALLQEIGLVDEVVFAHPKDLQDGWIGVNAGDILANVPFVEGCGLWFDHHSSENYRLPLAGRYQGESRPAPSTARIIYEFYARDPNQASRLHRLAEMVDAVDKADSAWFTSDDILRPEGWMMLAFIADPRTGLGYRRTFRVSNLEMMKSLPLLLRTHTVEEILALPDYQERVDVYRDETEHFQQFLRDHSYVAGDALVIDLRNCNEIPSGNRFIEHVLFPEQNISIRLVTAKDPQQVMISVGHSVINRTSKVDVGGLMLWFGGGGSPRVGTCQVMAGDADEVLEEILRAVNTE